MKTVEVRPGVLHYVKENGNIKKIEYYNKNGVLDRKDGPAYTLYQELYGCEDWCPYYVKTKKWYANGNITKEEHYNFEETITKRYEYKGNIVFRTTYYYDNGNIKKIAYINTDRQYHREDGPAVTIYNEDGSILAKQYYYNGKKISNELQLLVLSS